jgi:hypothetical protein
VIQEIQMLRRVPNAGPAASGDDADAPYPTGVFDDRRPG